MRNLQWMILDLNQMIGQGTSPLLKIIVCVTWPLGHNLQLLQSTTSYVFVYFPGMCIFLPRDLVSSLHGIYLVECKLGKSYICMNSYMNCYKT